MAGTRAAQIYGVERSLEDYFCRYGVAPEHRRVLEEGGLRTSGFGGDGEVRIVELPGHPFFIATLFLPQARSTAARPHPLLAAFAAAARAFRRDHRVA